ncbi:MAG: LytTR family DNA-binding domain-containing protein [Beijerinckiaceae bacterium]
MHSPLLRFAVLATLGGLLLGALGPFGSYLNGGFPIRAAYWVCVMWIGFALYFSAYKIARRIAPAGNGVAWLAIISGIIIASFPMALVSRVIAFHIWPRLSDVGPNWTNWYVQTVTLGLIITFGSMAILELIGRNRKRDEQHVTVGHSESGPSAIQAYLTQDVLALQMEDHYVRVHTATDSRLILMPLAEAIDALAAKDGLRTHRSWWVARKAVVQVKGTPRSMTLVLSNGIVAPVSRSSVALLRAAGWLN